MGYINSTKTGAIEYIVLYYYVTLLSKTFVSPPIFTSSAAQLDRIVLLLLHNCINFNVKNLKEIRETDTIYEHNYVSKKTSFSGLRTASQSVSFFFFFLMIHMTAFNLASFAGGGGHVTDNDGLIYLWAI